MSGRGGRFLARAEGNFQAKNRLRGKKAPNFALCQAMALLRRLANCFSHASACETMVSRFWNLGRQGSVA
jgi:hypothetical protein